MNLELLELLENKILNLINHKDYIHRSIDR